MAERDEWSLPELAGRKTSLYLTRKASGAFLRGKTLVLPGEPDREIPLASIRRVALCGKAFVDMAIVYELLRSGIPIDWLDIFGNPLALFLPLEREGDGFLLQQARFGESPASLELARQMLQAKFENCHEALRRKTAFPPDWRDSRKGLLEARSAASLRGEEGYAARRYFSLWPGLVAPFEWPGRIAHPAPDPVNMLLSLGYGMLRNRLASALRFAGLDPRLGFFHEARGSHCALASDLMEPLRPLIDLAVLRLIRLREIKPDDFTTRFGKCACAGKYVFPKILGALEDAFNARHAFYPHEARGDEAAHMTVNDCLDEMARGYALHVASGAPCFVPRLVPWPAA